jgi:hypothetical protein
VPVIFKGSGFYVTDHKKNNPASTPEKGEKSGSTPAVEKKIEKPKPAAAVTPKKEN